jgi:hypothetical protein
MLFHIGNVLVYCYKVRESAARKMPDASFYDRRSVSTHFDYGLIISKRCKLALTISGMTIKMNVSNVTRRNGDMRTIYRFIDICRVLWVLAFSLDDIMHHYDVKGDFVSHPI